MRTQSYGPLLAPIAENYGYDQTLMQLNGISAHKCISNTQ